MSDYRYDQSPLSRGLMGAGQALTGVAGAISKAAEMKTQAAAMQSKVDLAKMQYNSLKLKNIQSLPDANLRYTGLMSKAGQEAWLGIYGTPMTEGIATNLSKNTMSELTRKFWTVAQDMDWTDPNTPTKFMGVIAAMKEVENDPTAAFGALTGFVNSGDKLSTLSKNAAGVNLSNQRARKEGNLADVYSTGVTSRSVSSSTSTTNSNKTPKEITIIQKKNSITNELKAWQAQAFKAKGGMDDLEITGKAFKPTKQVDGTKFPTDRYIEYKNQFNEADRHIKDLSQQLEQLRPAFESNPLSTYDTGTTIKTTNSESVSTPKMGAKARYIQLIKKEGKTPGQANKIVADELKAGKIVKDY